MRSIPTRRSSDLGGTDRPPRIMVFDGQARFVGGGIDRTINAGQALVLKGGAVAESGGSAGPGTGTLSAVAERAAPSDFVRWARSHEYDRRKLTSAYYVSPSMTGYEELDSYGKWETVPDYGQVWYPDSVAADWAPYRQGRWVWIEPWGWNWVDSEPWGFAPFHYGRWARIEDRWAWVPGEYAPEPVYAPALVAFIPPSSIEAASILPADSGPPVGWFPLAPGEVYWPTYTSDPGYIRNVNITNVNVRQINQIVTVVQREPRAAAPPPQVVEQRLHRKR